MSLEGFSSDLLKRKIPIVCIDRRPKIDSNVAFIASDHYAGGFMATEELIQKGCRRILVLTKQQNLSSVNERLNGFSDAMLKHKVGRRTLLNSSNVRESLRRFSV
ncbi:LacI family transcriptional regulator [Paenibacillus sp. 28ISP30-2]|nr:LacI family transcriptional regulator [Paenibacillus sp. 28ISP30-2]